MRDSDSATTAYAQVVIVRKPPSPLALRRITLGLEQRDVCLLTGMTQPWLSLLENGHRRPRTRTKQRLAAALNCDVGDIFPVNESSPAGEPGSTKTTDAGGRRAEA